MLTEAQLRFRRTGAWLQETSDRHASVVFIVASLYQSGDDVHLSVVVTPAEEKLLSQLSQEWRKDARIKSIVGPYTDPRGARFQFVYSRQHSTYPILVKHNLFSFRFVAVTRGAQYLTVMGESKEVESLVKDLEKVGTLELVSVTKVASDASPEGPSALPLLFKGLSEPQLRALLLAYDRGYYSWPRKITASDLAHGVGLTAPSFLHHLRLAEDRLISAALGELSRLDPGRVAAVRSLASGEWTTQAKTPRKPRRGADGR